LISSLPLGGKWVTLCVRFYINDTPASHDLVLMVIYTMVVNDATDRLAIVCVAHFTVLVTPTHYFGWTALLAAERPTHG